MAAAILANISPMINMAMVSLTFIETNVTKSNTKKLPKLAARTILHLEVRARAIDPVKKVAPIMAKATPKLAPELIPKTNGPASGFLNRVCINKPETPSPEPTIIAVIAFGKR